MFPNTYGYYPQQQQQTQIFYLKGRPVSSIDEARAMGIDFDGSVFYFPDLANKRIYTKQINQDGTATLNMYELKNEPILNYANTNNFITREEFEDVIKKLRESLTPSTTSENQPQPQSIQF
jgi:hypothetical protein